MSPPWSESFRFLSIGDVTERATAQGPVEAFLALSETLPGLPRRHQDFSFAQAELGLTDHLATCLEAMAHEADQGRGPLPREGEFDSIPFHDLAYGLLLPLDGMTSARSQRLFGLRGPAERLDSKARRAAVASFLARGDLGLPLLDKVALIRSDPFLGRDVGTSLNVLLDVLASVCMDTATGLRDELGRVGDVQELFVSRCPRHRSDPPLTTREVLLTLRHLRGRSGHRKKAALRSLLERAGRLEVYFLTGFLRRGGRVSQTLGDDALIDAMAEVLDIDRGRLDVARSLVDVFELARLLQDEGREGLARLALRPLMPVGPMLAGPEVPKDLSFPVFFEKKYDGVRLMVHKSAAGGRVRVAAFTRRRLEWTEQLPGLLPLVHALPCREVILDGELHGSFFSDAGPRPASVYDVLKTVRGEPSVPLRLRFTAFDVIYLEGRDLTTAPFHERRTILERLVGPASLFPLPLPLELSDGQRVDSRQDMMRLYTLFRAQGYEGGIAKAPGSDYALGRRSDAWTKLKPALTLDLAITGALYTTSAEGPMSQFSTYLVSALADGPSLEEVGRVQGLGALDSAQLLQAILDDGLLTGRRLERETSSGRKAGVELRPGIVATVRFEGIVRDDRGRLAMRDPKILRVRTGEKDLDELDKVKTLEELFLKQRFR